ncbi:MAG: hypothetical protein ACOX77_06470, partial [Caldicoprobacterales bacterium]
KYRYHKDNENLFQEIYQTIAGYFQDDDADEFINDPVFNTLLEMEYGMSIGSINIMRNGQRCPKSWE